VSWQIVPKEFMDVMAGEDQARANRAMQAVLGMKRLDIAEIQRAPEAA
jgi:predicted 3-demethylubiquinone-9 3-methyltransferase (glyoxalase superfamily)